MRVRRRLQHAWPTLARAMAAAMTEDRAEAARSAGSVVQYLAAVYKQVGPAWWSGRRALTSNERNEAFAPTHRVGTLGQGTWPAPDGNTAPGPPLAPSLEVQVAETSGEWARIVCSNGWSAWVDGRLLVPIAESDQPSGPPVAPAIGQTPDSGADTWVAPPPGGAVAPAPRPSSARAGPPPCPHLPGRRQLHRRLHRRHHPHEHPVRRGVDQCSGSA